MQWCYGANGVLVHAVEYDGRVPHVEYRVVENDVSVHHYVVRAFPHRAEFLAMEYVHPSFYRQRVVNDVQKALHRHAHYGPLSMKNPHYFPRSDQNGESPRSDQNGNFPHFDRNGRLRNELVVHPHADALFPPHDCVGESPVHPCDTHSFMILAQNKV